MRHTVYREQSMIIHHYSGCMLFGGGWAQFFIGFLLICAAGMPFSHLDGVMMVIMKSIGVLI